VKHWSETLIVANLINERTPPEKSLIAVQLIVSRMVKTRFKPSMTRANVVKSMRKIPILQISVPLYTLMEGRGPIWARMEPNTKIDPSANIAN
jgi:hypothetical protein